MGKPKKMHPMECAESYPDDLAYFKTKMFDALAVPKKLFAHVDLASGPDCTALMTTTVQGKTVVDDVTKGFAAMKAAISRFGAKATIVHDSMRLAAQSKSLAAIAKRLEDEAFSELKFHYKLPSIHTKPYGDRTQMAGVYHAWKMFSAMQDYHLVTGVGLVTEDDPPKLTAKGIETLKRYGVQLKGDDDGEES